MRPSGDHRDEGLLFAICTTTMRGDTTPEGSTTGTPVNDLDYQVPFTFMGKLAKLMLTLDRPKLTPVDEKRLMQTAKRD